MTDLIAAIDLLAANWLSPAIRVCLWGLLSAGISMWIYKLISPQQKMIALKETQKEARKALLAHEGDFDELRVLVKRDLSLSLKLIGLAIFPFLISLLPLFVLMIPLTEIYIGPVSSFGPDWMQSFEFWYISALVIGSIIIKVVFKIA